jgi:hypothetical protein
MKSGDEKNYNVDFAAHKGNNDMQSTIAMMLRSRVKTLRRKDAPFNQHKLGTLFPKRKLYHKTRAKSCVIVSSAGSLLGSKLGEFIGSIHIFY